MNANTIRRMQAQDQMRRRMKVRTAIATATANAAARAAAGLCTCPNCTGRAPRALIPLGLIPEGLADLLGARAEGGTPPKAH